MPPLGSNMPHAISKGGSSVLVGGLMPEILSQRHQLVLGEMDWAGADNADAGQLLLTV